MKTIFSLKQKEKIMSGFYKYTTTISLILICLFTQQISQAQIDTAAIQNHIAKFENGSHIEIGIYDNGKTHTLAFKKDENGNISAMESQPKTLFEIGSLSKVLTAFITHDILEQDHKLNVNTKLSDINSSIPLHPDNNNSIIHLMNHTSGLAVVPIKMYIWGKIKRPKQPYLIFSKKKLINYYKNKKSPVDLGTKHSYSNTGYAVLGLLASDISQQSIDSLFSNKIQTGLGLKNTHLKWSEKIEPSIFNKNCVWKWNATAPAGGGYSCLEDMLRFIHLNMELESLSSSYQTAFLSMRKKSLELSEEESLGAGWFIRNKNKENIYYHQGGTRGYKSFLAIDPNKKRGIIILSQKCGLKKNNGTPKNVGFDILDNWTFTPPPNEKLPLISNQ